jgi:hypothetical protein
MKLPMLLLLQAAAQHLPPINVTLQQPPGLPFWQTTIISALVGTFFGLASSALLEFVKPAISVWLLQKTILKNLDEEFSSNFAAWLDAQEIMDACAAGMVDVERAKIVFDSMAVMKDRYNYYQENEKAAFYGLGKITNLLGKFYVLYEGELKRFPKPSMFPKLTISLGEDYRKLRRIPEIKPIGAFATFVKG